MFNLDQAIEAWRRQMAAAGIKSPVPLEELESHLRDDIEEQLRTGMSAQAAFDAAVARLGQADVLKSEFKRGRFDIRSVSPVFLRVYCFLCVPFLLSMIWSFAEEAVMQRYLRAVVVSLTAFYVGVLPICYRRLFTRQDRLMRWVLWVGNWVAIAFPLLALLGTFGIVRLGDTAGMILWSAVAAQVANVLAYANFEREQLLARTTRLFT